MFWMSRSHLLHVSEDVLTTVEDSSAFLGVQVEDEVGAVVRIAVFVPFGEGAAERYLNVLFC